MVTKQPGNRLAMRATVLLLTGTVGVGSYLLGENQQGHNDRQPRTEVAAYAAANLISKIIKDTSSLQAPRSSASSQNPGYVDLHILQGTVEQRSSNGWTPVLQDPIELAGPTDSIFSTDPSSPTYVGTVSGTPQSGPEIVVTAMTPNYRFVPDDLENPRRAVAAYATSTSNDGVQGIEMIAFDPTGNTNVTDPQGDLITPGRPLI